MQIFTQLLQINPTNIPHDGLRKVVETLQKEYSQAKNKALVEETLGERAKQAVELVKAKFPKALGDRSRIPDALAEQARANFMENKARARAQAQGYLGAFSETTSLGESYEMYNPDITDEELSAYLHAHPDSHLHTIFQPKYDEEYLIEKGLLFYHKGKLEYRYEYLSGDIYSKLRRLDGELSDGGQDVDAILEKYGASILEKQVESLLSIRPLNKKLSGDGDTIHIDAYSELCKRYMVSELNPTDISLRLNEPLSIRDAFVQWIYAQKSHIMPYRDKADVVAIYVENKPPRLDKTTKDKLTDTQKEEQKAARRENIFALGRKKFREFLTTAVPANVLKALETAWNERYNALVEVNYSKIPISFTFSKTFKNDKPLRLTKAQRDGIAFLSTKGSACLGYDVGVGKTLTSLACVAEAFDAGRAKVALVVVPDQTYHKWVYEIKGGDDKKTGKTLRGSLPHINLFAWGNLNRDTIRNEVKFYTDEEEQALTAFEDALPKLRELEGLMQQASVAGAKEEYLRHADSYKSALEALPDYRGKSQDLEYLSTQGTLLAEMKSFKAIPKIYKKVYRHYTNSVNFLGEAKAIPPKSIILVNYHGAKQIGIGAKSQEELKEALYRILNQGGLMPTDADGLSNSIQEAMGSAKEVKKAVEKEKKIEEQIGQAIEGTKLLMEELGIDMLVMDEAHNAKKVFTRVMGEADSEGNRERTAYALDSGTPSQLAIQMFMLSQYIQRKNEGRNVLMLTATPFTNSPLEVFSMLALTNWQRLVEIGQASLVEFFNTYIKEERQLVIDAANKAQIKPVVTGFNNLPELKQLVFDIIDYKTGEDAQVNRPAKITFGNRITLSDKGKVETISKENAIVKMNPKQEFYMQKMVDYLESDNMDVFDLCGDAIEKIAEGTACKIVEEYIKNIEKAADAKPDPDAPENPGVKVLRTLNMGKLNALSPYLFSCNDLECPTAQEFVEESPKIQYVVECIRTVKKYHEARNEPMSGQVIYSDTGVKYFFLIRQYLIDEVGFQPSEVEIVASTVYDANAKGKALSKSRKERIKQGFLRGDVKVVIGSSTIKEGIDLQTRSTCLYLLTPDWNPTDYNQVEGRIWRQGNIHKYVRIINVMCADSADVFIYQKLGEKQRRLKVLLDKSDTTSQLSLEEYDPEEIKESLIRDPELKAQMQIKRETKAIDLQIDEATVKLLTYSNIDFDLIDKFDTAHRNFVRWLNQLHEAYATFKFKRDKKEDEEKKAKYEAKYADKIASGEKEPYESKFDPNSPDYQPIVFNPTDKSKDYIRKMTRSVQGAVRVANRNINEEGFNQMDMRVFEEVYYNWRNLRDKYDVLANETLPALGISGKEDLNKAVEQQEKRIEALRVKRAQIQESIEDRVKENVKFREQYVASFKTVPEQVKVFASLNHYMDAKVAEKATKAITQAKQATRNLQSLYQKAIKGMKLMLTSAVGEMREKYEKAIRGMELMENMG